MSKFLEEIQKRKLPLDGLPPLEARPYPELVRELSSQPQPDKGIYTGIAELDAITGGFMPGELIILSAPTKEGKTTMAQTITWNMSTRGIPTMWFTMEMSWRELTNKFKAMDEVYQHSGEPSEVPICYPLEYYRGQSDLMMFWLAEAIAKAKDERGIGLVVIDHLHFLLPLSDYKQNVSFLIGGIVREVKKIAVQLEVPIILIAHVGKMETDKTPDINSIRDSSFITQESDFTLMMWRVRSQEKIRRNESGEEAVDIFTPCSYLSVEANRRTGKTGRIKLWFNGAKFEKYANQDGLADKAKLGFLAPTTENKRMGVVPRQAKLPPTA